MVRGEWVRRACECLTLGGCWGGQWVLLLLVRTRLPYRLDWCQHHDRMTKRVGVSRGTMQLLLLGAPSPSPALSEPLALRYQGSRSSSGGSRRSSRGEM